MCRYTTHLLLMAIMLVSVIYSVINLISPANAELDSMTWKQLRKNRDFRIAVQNIISDCRVEDGKINCD